MIGRPTPLPPTIVPGMPDYRYIAWHQGGAQTLRIGQRHVAHVSAGRNRPRKTLCGRPWRVSREVVPNDYWTLGDCQRCERSLHNIRLQMEGTP